MLDGRWPEKLFIYRLMTSIFELLKIALGMRPVKLLLARVTSVRFQRVIISRGTSPATITQKKKNSNLIIHNTHTHTHTHTYLYIVYPNTFYLDNERRFIFSSEGGNPAHYIFSLRVELLVLSTCSILPIYKKYII